MIHRFDEFEFDHVNLELRRKGVRVALEPRVLDLLAYLLARSQRLVTKDDLLTDLWGGLSVSESSLTRSMSNLRSALGDSRQDARIIETVHGRGYRFTATIRTEPKWAAVEGDSGREADPFVGRGDILSQLTSTIDDVFEGKGSLVLLSGEAGIGKTRTAEQLARRATERGAVVRVGRCREELGAPPLWPWVQIFRQEVQDLGVDRMRELLGHEGRDVARLIPELRGVDSSAPYDSADDASSARFRLFDSIWRYLQRAAQERPRVLVLDDLHRADPTSLALLCFISSELEPNPTLIVGTFRDAELVADPTRSAQVLSLVREPAARLIALDGLSAAGISELADAIGDLHLSLEECERLRAYTGGNPFFLRHVLMSFETGGARPVVERLPKLPLGIQSALASEIRSLDPETYRLLRSASVLGGEFHVFGAVEVCDLDPASILENLQHAMRLRLVEELPERQGGYRFVHELIREALYEDLAPLERARLHLLAGEALEKRYGTEPGIRLTELAHHFLQASSLADPDKAFRYVRAAGEWAQEQLAFEEAVNHHRAALELLDLMEQEERWEVRCDLLIALAEASARSGQRTAAAADGWRAAEIARAHGSPERLARAALAVSPGFFALEIGVFDPQLASLLELALEALEPRTPDEWVFQARLFCRLALCLYWSGREEQILHVSHAATEAAIQVGLDDARGYALVSQHTAIAGPGGAGHRLVLARELVELAERRADHEQALMGRVFRLTALLELGRVTEFDQEIPLFEKLAEQFRQPQNFWYSHMYRAMRALMRGHFDEAHAAAQEYLALGRRIDDNNVLHCFASHTLVSTLEREISEDIVFATEAHMNQHPEYLCWRAGLAWAAAESTRRDIAEPLLDEMAGRLFNTLPRDINWLCTVGLLAYTAWHLGAVRHARTIYEKLEPHADGIVTAGFGMVYFGSVESYLGRLATLLEEPETALAHFERALVTERRHGAAPWVVRTLESKAEALRRFHSEADARSVAQAAHADARRLGMSRVAKRLER